jgi:short subunit dehydrogenase-like uncharacterized protein
MATKLANAHTRAFALFGVTGVTGRLVLERALARGHRPTLIGRDQLALMRLAEPHGLEARQATLDDADSLRKAITGHQVVVNIAGPFKRTAEPLTRAALAVGVDYIDLNGELEPLQHLLEADDAARARGVVLVGGAGFGVAATDGLAMQVSDRLGGAEWVRLSIAVDSAFSSLAVAESTLDVLAGGGCEVERGMLKERRLARRRWVERKPDGTTIAFASAPLAELAAVRHITGAREVIAGVPMAPGQARVLAMIAPLLPALLKIRAVRRQMAAATGHAGGKTGKQSFTSRVWLEGGMGDARASALLEADEGYGVAADIAVLAVETLLAERPQPGAYTPAAAFGPGFIERSPGVRITHNPT